MIENNIVHAEIFFDSQTHLNRGISFKDVVDGLNEGFDKGRNEGLSINLISCILRDGPVGDFQQINCHTEINSDNFEHKEHTAWDVVHQTIA